MGLSPNEVARTSIWRLMQAWRGYRQANGQTDGPQAPSDDEFERAVREARE